MLAERAAGGKLGRRKMKIVSIALCVACLCVPEFAVTQPLQPEPTASATGLVVSGSDLASDIGASVLSRGGNAVDAAVATAFALAVTYPFAGNIGGGGSMIVRTPNGNAVAIDYREKAPAASTPTMYLNAEGNIDRALTASGYVAPGVPGTVRGLALAHKRFGKLPWAEVVRPAARLAADGFNISAALARSLNAELERMRPFAASVAAYSRPGGGAWNEGDRLVLPDLARSLEAIAADGPDVFYEGWIADRIAQDMAAHGGLITKADLAAYRAKARKPVTTSFLDFDVLSMPPPSSGGVTLIEMLNMLEAMRIQDTTRLSPAAIHLMVEAMRRAYLDRARFLGDPDFAKIPTKALVSKKHARELIADVEPRKASSSAELGKDIISAGQLAEPSDTTHFSVLDRAGMAVSNTYTLEGGYGSHVVIAGTGILLNNEMGDFNKKPGTTNLTGDIGTPANVIAPGKRMLSSMTPTMVTRNGRIVLITGSPGSRTIINTVLNIILDVTAWHLPGPDAVAAPRLDHEWLPDRVTIEAGGVPADTVRALEGMGHEVRMQGQQGSAHSIWIDPRTGTAVGIPDLRDSNPKAAAAR
jgi:gamma-glutamyltranspeptidase/glutathione hydrolase